MDLRYWLTAPLLIAFLLAFGLAPTASAQTPNATIENKSGETALESSYSGGLLAPGKFGDLSNYNAPNDSIPAEGAGTRMMWYPEKAAFRAGRVGDISGKGDVWDADSIGRHSIALGLDTRASGRRAVALGYATTATLPDAMAMGVLTAARGPAAMAMGSATAANNAVATAMGLLTTASGSESTAMGRRTTAAGRTSTAMGLGTVAATNESLSVGQCNDRNRGNDDGDSETGPLFVVGNGMGFSSNSCDNRDDAFVVEQNGNAVASSHDTFSDRRLKTDIEPISEGTLEKLSELRPVRYEFKNRRAHPSGEQIGLVAQDVQEHFPELVSEGSGGMLSLAYPKMTAVLLKGIQEQQAQIEKKESRLKRQQEQIADLKSENEEIKKRQEKLEERLAALEEGRSSALPAGLTGPWALALLLGLGGLAAGLLWRRGA